MTLFIDLTGKKFNKLTVIKRVEKPEHIKQGTYWLCLCDCGNEAIVSGGCLKTGQQSCGCAYIDDLTGRRFGRLIVTKIDKTKKETRNGTYWECCCDCGNTTSVLSPSLKGGRTKSCGCLQKDISREKSLGHAQAAINRLFRIYKRGARKRELEFRINRDEFIEITSKNCFYCGIEPKQICSADGRSGDYIYNGIDRVDSDKGYYIENCVPCCGQCNRIKSNLTQKEFKSWVNSVHNHWACLQ